MLTKAAKALFSLPKISEANALGSMTLIYEIWLEKVVERDEKAEDEGIHPTLPSTMKM